MNIKIDLCIVIDVTGSIRLWLEEAKHRIGLLVDEEILRAVKSIKGKDVALRFAFVAYKDLPEHPAVCEFETDISRIKEKIFAINAGGGGDIPEDVHGALEAVRMLAWAQAG
jgi:hypothetical protein